MQVLVELFLDALDRFIAVFEVFEGTLLVAGVKHDWTLLSLRHDDSPHFVHGRESDVDFGQLGLDVGRAKDRPQVAPTTLSAAPLFQDFLNFDKARLPVKCLGQEVLAVGRARNDHCLLDMLI